MSRSRAAFALLVAVCAAPGCKNITGGRAAEGTVGAACVADDECESGSAPICLGMPAGYCSFACGATGGDECGGEAVCEGLDAHARYCLDGCLTRNGNEDCRPGYRCAERPDVANLDGEPVGVCLPACTQDAECEVGRRCDVERGSCVQPGAGAVGAPCGRAEDCAGALCALGSGFVGGLCSARCGPGAEACPGNAACVAFAASPMCLPPCNDDADCRTDEGYRCRATNGVRVCLPACRVHADCGADEHCEVASGQCRAGAPRGAALGAACGEDADCAVGGCATDWPHGACVRPCPCPSDPTIPCASSRVADRCVAPCATDAGCRAGYVCEDAACQPRCTGDEACPDGRFCERASGRCEAADDGAVQVQTITLAEAFPVGSRESEALSVTLPEGVLGFGLVIDGQGSDLLVLADLRDPDGRVLYDLADPLRGAARFFPADQAVAAVLPVTPGTAPRPGTYRFRLIKDGPTRFVRVRAVVKAAPAGQSPTQATLDANIVFVGVDAVDAARAPKDAAFQSVLERLSKMLALGGVTLGRVRLCDMPAAQARAFSTIESTEGTDNELSRLFETTRDVGAWGCEPSAGLTWFMVDEIQGGLDGYTILGVAGGIPGPPGVVGTGHSGVAVTLAGYRRSPGRVALTMAHEAGHYFGLFHTTEAEATLFDPLDDTPRCERDRDEDGNGLLDYPECLGAGAENLMFWAAGAADAVSEAQGFVLRRNPGLR